MTEKHEAMEPNAGVQRCDTCKKFATDEEAQLASGLPVKVSQSAQPLPRLRADPTENRTPSGESLGSTSSPQSLKDAVEGLRAGAEDAFDDLDPVDAYVLRCLAMVEDCVRGVISAGSGVPPKGVRS